MRTVKRGDEESQSASRRLLVRVTRLDRVDGVLRANLMEC